MKKWMLMAVGILILVIGILIKYNRGLHSECARHSNNISVLNKEIERYKIQDSLNAVSVSALNLTIDELKEYRADDAQTIKELGIKNKHLEALVKNRDSFNRNNLCRPLASTSGQVGLFRG